MSNWSNGGIIYEDRTHRKSQFVFEIEIIEKMIFVFFNFFSEGVGHRERERKNLKPDTGLHLTILRS